MQLAEDGDRQASKLAALWHDIWLEAYSWLRYFFVYLLPRGLSYPFQFAIWNGFYTLLLVAVLAGNVGTGPVRDFLQALRFDLWSKLFGQNSGTALGALLTSLPGWFVFGGGILLVVWGGSCLLLGAAPTAVLQVVERRRHPDRARAGAPHVIP